MENPYKQLPITRSYKNHRYRECYFNKSNIKTSFITRHEEKLPDNFNLDIGVCEQMRIVHQITKLIYEIIGNPCFLRSNHFYGEILEEELKVVKNKLKKLLKTHIYIKNNRKFNVELMRLLQNWGFKVTITVTQYRVNCSIETPKGKILL